MDKSTSLIEKLRIEGNTEFHRCQGNAALDQIIGAVERLDLGAPPGVVSRCLEFVNDVLDDAVGHCLAILGDAMLRRRYRPVRIEIAPPDNQRVQPEMMRHLVDGPFNPQHPLWPTKAAKGSV